QTYEWDFGDGETATGVEPSSHVYDEDGTYTIKLTVTDDGGMTGTASQIVVVAAGVTNKSPVASFTVSVNYLTVTVDGSGSTDADGNIAKYEWSFGDGSQATGATPAPHAYSTAATRTIKLTVTDDHGATGVFSKSVTTMAPPVTGPGAKLPITYALGAVGGTKLFVATNGSNSNSGTENSPLATLSTAIGKVGSGQSATIVIRGGEYPQGETLLPSNRTIRIIAYPGEVPVFRGSQKLTSGWTTEGNLKWHAYTPRPVTDGSGISFSSGQNLAGNKVGKYPDQAWIGQTELRQVPSKGEIVANTFWVDSGNKRIYMLSSDVNKGNVEASDLAWFLRVSAKNATIEGIRIERFSNTASDYGVIRFESAADDSVLRHVELFDASFLTLSYGGSAGDILQGALLDHVTIGGSNWMGVNTSYVDDVVLQSVKITNLNPFGEFTTSPQSGALKTSRCRRVRVLDSEISDNQSHGLWFDQSNLDVDVAGNVIVDNNGSAVFFEISDDFLLINNYVKSDGGNRAVKLAGSSGIKLINNTIVGGADPVGIYTDNRSKPGCADPNQPLCENSYGSDRRSAATRPATLDWMPRLDLMVGNIIAYPSASGYCGGSAAVCVTSSNANASAPIETILHGEEPGRGIPRTRIDGNVYANGNSSIVRVSTGNYSSTGAWSAAAAGAPISLSGIDSNSKHGNSYVNADGSATVQLDHSEALPIATDTEINQYISAGTRHYGWLK
ncbi:MAG: right-handed parallel beta-helix repeat-containing protein, partial [Myxococcales bacterium]|nr:right-handed parallel beta-helix repeat-containing protein [Myxococcales bacterium]